MHQQQIDSKIDVQQHSDSDAGQRTEALVDERALRERGARRARLARALTARQVNQHQLAQPRLGWMNVCVRVVDNLFAGH